jgi:hypothetical protein
MRFLRLSAPLVAAAVALACISVARADEGADNKGVYGFIMGLRQSVSDTGRRAMDEAEGALARLELGAGIGQELRPGLGLAAETASGAAVTVGAGFAAQVPSDQADNGAIGASILAQKRLSLSDIAMGGDVVASNRSWSLDRARADLGAEIGSAATGPDEFLASNIYRGPNTGAALAEHAYEGRDIELGMPVPLVSNLSATVAHYWWGERAFTPTVDGYRFSLRYDLSKYLKFEGGDTQDQLHGSAGFFGIRYTKPLGLDRPLGVMPR